MGPEQFHVEVLKLLLQIATVDGSVARSEIEHIMDTARGMSVPLPELAALTRCLQNGEPLPPPNMGILRTNPTAVIKEAKALITSDGTVHAAEIELLRQIREMLGVIN
ncbi:hypothetical protein A176_005792 [Myxococcus hansupus]|uniref:Co-chaperone DjlA N-terminal domain-containing protein n=1 Tax=Pseudomyxococcus hansupus TaxID=1297742 RepID=A0A0H4X5J4_9BACT|nr:TerB family tellurite resistance protein [Myxococcus hansupus]AKQ68880.1 hypothetical protein A176_005792 [Myxococcus hansupus]